MMQTVILKYENMYVLKGFKHPYISNSIKE